MLQRIRVAALAVMIGAGTLVALAPAAATAAPPAPEITRVHISPNATLDVTNGPVTATFSFLTKNADTAEFQVKAPGEVSVYSSIGPLTKGATHLGWTKWSGTKQFKAADVGKWAWRALAHRGGTSDQADGTFEVVVKKLFETRIADFDATPDLVNQGDLIRLSGRLLADGNGYAGQTVSITFRERGSDTFREVTKVTTGRGGWFGTRVKAVSTGWWRAEFAATSAAKGSVSDSDRVDVRRHNLDSKIVGFDARPEPVVKGDKLYLGGSLLIESRGGVAGQRVAIYFKAAGSNRWEYVTSDITGRNGRFFTSVEAVTSGWWRAQYNGRFGVNGTVSAPDWVTVNQPAPPQVEKADSRLVKFNAYPEPINRGRYLKFKAQLQIDDEGSWEAYEGKVALYFKPLKSKKWEYVKTVWSSDSGRLYTKVKAWNSGHWRFVFGGDDDAYGSISAKDYVRVKR